MTKVAKLVYVSLMTRVIVDADATEQDIINASRESLIEKINDESFAEHVEEVIDDFEVPFGEAPGE